MEQYFYTKQLYKNLSTQKLDSSFYVQKRAQKEYAQLMSCRFKTRKLEDKLVILTKLQKNTGSKKQQYNNLTIEELQKQL